MSKPILVTGATGKQGGAVINALLASKSASQWTILAATRNAQSESAKKLAAKSNSIKIVQGDQDDVPSLFQAAKTAAGQPLWGVYSVQAALGKGYSEEGETKQGKAMVDESVKNGVKHFVYSSVERGGDEKSWSNPTNVPHFKSKHEVELHLRDQAAKAMSWTILRPVAFFDNLEPGFPARVFLAAMQGTLKEKRLQWIATSDIGSFAAMAFENPQEFSGKSIGLAGDELSVDEMVEIFKKNSTQAPTPTFGFLGSVLKMAVGEMGTMINWFASDGYGADINRVKQMKPDVKGLAAWIQQDSAFAKK